MSYQTPHCLSPGDVAVPEVTCAGWRATDVRVPDPNHCPGWYVTAWDLDGSEYGRKLTDADFAKLLAERHG